MLVHVEEDGRAAEGDAGDILLQKVDALHVDAGLVGTAGLGFAKNVGILHQGSLEKGGNLEALGHDVRSDEALALCFVEHLLKARQLLGAEDPGLIGEDVQAGGDCRHDGLELAAVVAGQNDHIARLFAHEAMKIIRVGMHLELPVGGVLSASIELCQPLQVREEAGAERSVNVDARVDAFVHLLVDEGGVKMAGMQSDEADHWEVPERNYASA